MQVDVEQDLFCMKLQTLLGLKITPESGYVGIYTKYALALNSRPKMIKHENWIGTDKHIMGVPWSRSSCPGGGVRERYPGSGDPGELCH